MVLGRVAEKYHSLIQASICSEKAVKYSLTFKNNVTELQEMLGSSEYSNLAAYVTSHDTTFDFNL